VTSLIERVYSRPRTTTLVATVMLSALAGMFLAAPASAYKVGGQRWPGKTPRISYYDATPSSYRASVQQAILAWNTSGVRLKFVKAKTRRRAQVLIHKGPAIGPGTGFASVGYAPNASVELNKGGMDQWDYAGIVAHELGHVIGLDHPSRGCAAMTPAVYMFCKPGFPPHAWQWRCRLLQRDDLNGAKRRYGGRTRLRPSMWCDKAPPAAAPPALSVVQLSGKPLESARLTVTIPARAVAVEVYRRLKTCPTSSRDGNATEVGTVSGKVGSSHALIDRQFAFELDAGSYCYRAFGVDQWRRTGGSRSTLLNYTGPPPTPPSAILALTPNTLPRPTDGSVPILMDVLVSIPAGVSAVRVYRKLGACATPQNPTGFDFVGEAPLGATARHVSDTNQPAEGHWCYAAFATSADGRRLSAAGTREIDYVPPRSASPTNFTAQRVDPNVDATGVHLSWTWPADASYARIARSTTGCASIDTVAELLAASPAPQFVDVTEGSFWDDSGVPPGPVCYAIETDDAFLYSSAVITTTMS
jgi:hypothetical protein